MNQINRLRSARWVMTFGTILEIDRNRPLPKDSRFKSMQRTNNTKKEKHRD